MNEISRKKEGREEGKEEEWRKKSDTYLFARSKPKIGNYISHTRKENMNNYVLLSVRKIKPTSSLEEAQLFLIQRTVKCFSPGSERK